MRYSGLYYGESLSDINLDCWSKSSLSAITKNVALGSVIIYLLLEYRSIAQQRKEPYYKKCLTAGWYYGLAHEPRSNNVLVGNRYSGKHKKIKRSFTGKIWILARG
jgi:hypothetical protein